MQHRGAHLTKAKLLPAIHCCAAALPTPKKTTNKTAQTRGSSQRARTCTEVAEEVGTARSRVVRPPMRAASASSAAAPMPLEAAP